MLHWLKSVRLKLFVTAVKSFFSTAVPSAFLVCLGYRILYLGLCTCHCRRVSESLDRSDLQTHWTCRSPRSSRRQMRVRTSWQKYRTRNSETQLTLHRSESDWQETGEDVSFCNSSLVIDFSFRRSFFSSLTFMASLPYLGDQIFRRFSHAFRDYISSIFAGLIFCNVCQDIASGAQRLTSENLYTARKIDWPARHRPERKLPIPRRTEERAGSRRRVRCRCSYRFHHDPPDEGINARGDPCLSM